ncbi:hypothetical protein [Lacibacter sediminis]|uniref:DUF4402 domain-containing protein n=1 Tax=Lacibacter sediminis TaxID=2760713 RepID=A0A7G5XIF8_9BACT|nr:hypothetical protein [Lacibacter sediminis]QNA45261.1 hypothetical protein H4075_03400 [Lacibacter sediminis]
MKQFFSFLICTLIVGAAVAQMPQAINYQAVARNNSGQPLANKAIKVRLSIVNTAAGNTALYSETRNVTTNTLGLFNVQIGGPGAISTTGNFASVNWLNNTSTSKALKVELDVDNSGLFIDMGIQGLTTVPYAFAADQSVNAINIGGHYVDTNTPTLGDVLKWDGSAWVAQRPAKTYNAQTPVNVVSGGNLQFQWAAEPNEITVYEGQTITAAISAILGTSSGTATQVGLAIIYQNSAGGPLVSFSGSGYLIVSAISTRNLYTVCGTVKVVSANATPNTGEIKAGTYKIGMGIRNTSSTAINNSDTINGFILVQ